MSMSKLSERLFMDTVNADVVFVVENKEIPGHRGAFATSCDYFDKLLNGEFKEAKSEKVEITGTSAKVFEELKRYIYLGQINTEDWNIVDLLGLLSVAHEYQIQELFAEVMKVVEKQPLDFDSWTMVNSAAAIYDSALLKVKCVSFAEAEVDNFLCLKNVEKMTEKFICVMFDTPKICTVNQDQLLCSLLLWKKTHSSAQVSSVFLKIHWNEVSQNIAAGIAKLSLLKLPNKDDDSIWDQLVQETQVQSQCLAKVNNVLIWRGKTVGFAFEKLDCAIYCRNNPTCLEFCFKKNDSFEEIPVKRIEFELSNQYSIQKVDGVLENNEFKGMDYKMITGSDNWLKHSATYSEPEFISSFIIYSENITEASEITLRSLVIY